MSSKAAAKKLMFAAAHALRVGHVARRRFAGIGIIFNSHRVIDPDEAVLDPFQAITTEFLSECIGHVSRRGYQIISLDQRHERLITARSGPPFACFTFDDGYRDNLTRALPIFREYGALMNIYVATDFRIEKSSIGGGRSRGSFPGGIGST
jgi:peptidoglycan/xylan/chitin deacetylase (PgdA/CDA1 family)